MTGHPLDHRYGLRDLIGVLLILAGVRAMSRAGLDRALIEVEREASGRV